MEICFTGPGTITLLNTTSSFKIVEKVSGNDVTFGAITGTIGNSIDIPTGEFCAVFPDAWGRDQCNCPPIPELVFTSTAAADVTIDGDVNVNLDTGDSCDNPLFTKICIDPLDDPLPVTLIPIPEEVPCGLVCWDDGTDSGRACHVMTRGADGIFTGAQRFLDVNSGTAIDATFIVECPQPQTILNQHCIL